MNSKALLFYAGNGEKISLCALIIDGKLLPGRQGPRFVAAAHRWFGIFFLRLRFAVPAFKMGSLVGCLNEAGKELN